MLVVLRARRRIAVLRIAAVIAGAVVATTGTVHAGYFPDRPVYDYNKYDPNYKYCDDPWDASSDHGRCGPTDGPVFDSFINVPSYGDERGFFDARRVDGPRGSTTDPLYGVIDGAREVTLRVYVDNDANEAYGYKTTAQATRLRVQLPGVTGQALRAVATISASNATPMDVQDSVDLVDTQPFRVEYVPGSAVILRNNVATRVDDEITAGGALITNNGMTGVFTAGFSKASLVELRIRIIPVVASDHVARWITAIGAVVMLLALAIWPVSRRKAVGVARSWWAWSRRHGLGVQILSNLLAAGLIVAAGLLVKLVFS